MIHNMGTADRTIRVVIGAAALLGVFFSWGTVVVGVALVLVAGLMLVTAAIGYCPTYRLLHISTNPTLHRVARPQLQVPAHH